VPLLVLPLLVPVVIAGASATAPLLAEPGSAAGLGGWLVFLGLYDVVFVLLSVGVFDFLLED
jgi:ABC-type transport system involved in cytochrome c biogenesis permease component